MNRGRGRRSAVATRNFVPGGVYVSKFINSFNYNFSFILTF